MLKRVFKRNNTTEVTVSTENRELGILSTDFISQHIMIDTDFSPKQMTTLVSLFADFKLSFEKMIEPLATKQELHEATDSLRKELKGDIQNLREEMHNEMKLLAKEKDVVQLIETVGEMYDWLREDHVLLETRVRRCEKAHGFI